MIDGFEHFAFITWHNTKKERERGNKGRVTCTSQTQTTRSLPLKSNLTVGVTK